MLVSRECVYTVRPIFRKGGHYAGIKGVCIYCEAYKGREGGQLHMFLFRIWEGSYPPRIRKQPAHFTNLFLLQSPTPTNPYTATQKLSHSTLKGTVSQDFYCWHNSIRRGESAKL